MLITCRDYLVQKLKDAGVQAQPFTSMKKLLISQSARVGAVLFDGETFDRSGSRTRYKDGEGAHKRTKVFDREVTFSVVIGDPVPERTEQLLEDFLRQLDNGVYIDGNYTPIQVDSAEWVDEDDSILKSKVGVNLKVKFIGGLYRDSGLAPVKDVRVIEVGKETDDGKQSIDGSGG